MRHPADYRDQEVLVLGLAKSGQAVAKLFHHFGAKVMVNDQKTREQCPEATELEELGITVICGGHPATLIHPDLALVIKNPGIPYHVPPVQATLQHGIEIVTEVEVAYHVSQAPVIGITGSNGKTTTTSWVGLMLEQADKSPIVAGNIGRPLSEVCLEASAQSYLIAELSSFQLKGTNQFRPQIACLLNVYETHLDYHGSMDDYIESKAKLFANQTAQDIAVLNMDDPVCQQLAMNIQAQILPFSRKQSLDYGVFLKRHHSEGNESIVYRNQQGVEQIIVRTDEIALPGKHNLENAMAAIAIALASGVEIAPIAAALRSFRGVEHRLEYVRTVRGATYYNDSKATNPNATITALEGFKSNVILIAGGMERGADFQMLIPYFRTKVKALIAMGETREQLQVIAERSGVPLIHLIEKGSEAAVEAMEEAVTVANTYAEAEDSVLLSPACASWDMFQSYEERGRMFKESVHNL